MRNAICAATQTSKVPTRVALLYVSLFCDLALTNRNSSVEFLTVNILHNLRRIINSSFGGFPSRRKS